MGPAGHACTGLLVYLREDRAGHPSCNDASHRIFRTASGKTAGIEAPEVFPGTRPSSINPGQDDRHGAITGALLDWLPELVHLLWVAKQEGANESHQGHGG